MIKSMFGVLVAGIALMPYVDAKTPPPVVAKAIAMQRSAVAPSLVEYTLNSASGQICHMKMLTQPVGGVAKLNVDSACDGMNADLSKAVAWVESENGTAQIIGSDGQTIMTVGPSDGFAYETFGSDTDIVTFSES